MVHTFRHHDGENATVPGAQPDIEIVLMRRRHVKEVVAIEKDIFPQPWSATLYYSELAVGSSRRYYVARAGKSVVGYAGCMVMVGEGHITTIGVAPAWQHYGIGKRLLYQLSLDALEMGAEALTLEVRVSNTAAQELYRQFGFVPAGIRKNYYAEIGEDGLVMWAHDIKEGAYAERLAAIGEQIAARLQRDEGTSS